MKNLTKTFRNLRAGNTLYTVHALGASSFMSTFKITARTKYVKHESMECLSGHKFAYEQFGGTSWNFVDDMNGYVGGDSYNEHKAFTSKRKAEKYLKDCITFDIGGCEYMERCSEVMAWNLDDDAFGDYDCYDSDEPGWDE